MILLLLPQIAFADSFSSKDMIFIEGRFGYGTQLSEQHYIKKIGLNNWMTQQLYGNLPESPQLQNALNNLAIENTASLLDKAKQFKDNHDKDSLKNLEKDIFVNTVEKDSLLALYSRNQLREKMTWFWFNHFNVYSNKGLDKLLFPDYEETIRKNALGNFKTILLDSLKSPAMLFYLDNFQNTDPNSIINQKNPKKPKGINENYARELLELHTLGQGNGYTQKDIQELARILTGFTFKVNNQEIKMGERFKPYVVNDGLFIFDPRKHDFGDKIFMGHVIKGRGYQEIEDVLNILVSSPYTAHHICQELAVYFVSDNPSQQLIEDMSSTFIKTKGDIKSVLSVMFNSQEFWNQENQFSKFKMPNEYIYSLIRLVYNDNMIDNNKPILNQLTDLGQRPFGHLTPDGYGLKNKDWQSSDQMSKRFNIANTFNHFKTPLLKDYSFNYEDVYKTINPILSLNTKKVLENALPQEKMGYLIASPELINK